MEGAANFAAPAAIGHPGGAEAVAAAVAHERSQFQSRRDAPERALAALEASRAVLETEIATLEEQLEGQIRLVAMLRESVGNMELLVERGLARSPI